MQLITTTKELKKACTKLKRTKFITVDTEFIRERNYWAKLCLIQVAGPKDNFIIDPLAEDIDLSSFYELMQNKEILKVFHACRQDLEIFFKEMGGKLPKPIFDTQIAAMVCGYGEQISYGNLVNSITKKKLDKSSRFTDWAQRPLSKQQLQYAISDVTYLRAVYEQLSKDLEEQRRKTWITDEHKALINKENYTARPEVAWQRIKIASNKPRVLGILQEIAAWREATAQKADVPRNRVMRDDILSSLALNPPNSFKKLSKFRGVQKGFAQSTRGNELLQAIKKGMAIPENKLPRRKKGEPLPPGLAPAIALLKVLLKITSEEHNVAQKLIANVSDLEQIAAYKEKADVRAMSGWRKNIFGQRALEILSGNLALSMEDNHMHLLEVEEVEV